MEILAVFLKIYVCGGALCHKVKPFTLKKRNLALLVRLDYSKMSTRKYVQLCFYFNVPKKRRKSSQSKKLLHNTALVSNRIRFILIELSWARICEDGQRALRLPDGSFLNNGEDWNPKRHPGPFIMNPQEFLFCSFLTRSVVRRRMCRGRLEWCCWTAKNWSWAAISRQSVKTFLIWWLHTSGSWNTIFSV